MTQQILTVRYVANRPGQTKINTKTMKQFQFGYIVRRFFATAAALALIAVTSLSASRVHAIETSELNTQTAEILALLSAVHELTSHNGDPVIKAAHFAAWKELWAEDATF